MAVKNKDVIQELRSGTDCPKHFVCGTFSKYSVINWECCHSFHELKDNRFQGTEWKEIPSYSHPFDRLKLFLGRHYSL